MPSVLTSPIRRLDADPIRPLIEPNPHLPGPYYDDLEPDIEPEGE